MARRGENIFKRGDGRWEARVIERRENGRRTYRSLYGKTYTEVRAKKEEYYGMCYCESAPAAKKLASFSFLAEQWLASVRGTVKESTYTRYHRTVYSYLTPALGKYSVSKIDSPQVSRFKEELLTSGGRRGEGLSEKTVTDILSVLKLILSHASAEGYPAMNTSLIRNPRRKKKEIATIPKEEIARLEEILLSSEDNISLGILLTLHTGIRNASCAGCVGATSTFGQKRCAFA